MNIPRALLYASVSIASILLAGQPAKATTAGVQVTFTESGDVLTVGGNRITGVVCTGETCSVTLNAPGSATFVSTTLPNTTGSTSYTIDEGNGFISDEIDHSVFNSSQNSVTLTFTSFDDTGAHCPSGGCNVVESGDLQFPGITITWSDGTTTTADSIGFQSDPPVPEPASLILLGSGLALAGGFLRRRRRPDMTPSV